MKPYDGPEFEKSILSGVFAGIAGVILCMVFNGYFKYATGLSLSLIVNAATIIFGFILMLTVSGFIFYFFHHNFSQGMLLFIILTALITAGLFLCVPHVQRVSDPIVAKQFRELLFGIVAIYGVCNVVGVPYFYKANYI